MQFNLNRKVVALLPMKANSERIKGKNFRPFNGKPLFRWILDTLLSIDEIELIIINTDARNLLAAYGLKENSRILIRDRPISLCGDLVSMNRIIENDIQNVKADTYLMTHTTNPLLSASILSAALNAFRESKVQGLADSLFSVTRTQTRFYRENGSPVNHDPNNLIPTQDLEPWFEENSNIYIFTAESFSSTSARIGKKPLLFETPKLESIDIDNQNDWDFALVASQQQCKKNEDLL